MNETIDWVSHPMNKICNILLWYILVRKAKHSDIRTKKSQIAQIFRISDKVGENKD